MCEVQTWSPFARRRWPLCFFCVLYFNILRIERYNRSSFGLDLTNQYCIGISTYFISLTVKLWCRSAFAVNVNTGQLRYIGHVFVYVYHCIKRNGNIKKKKGWDQRS